MTEEKKDLEKEFKAKYLSLPISQEKRDRLVGFMLAEAYSDKIAAAKQREQDCVSADRDSIIRTALPQVFAAARALEAASIIAGTKVVVHMDYVSITEIPAGETPNYERYLRVRIRPSTICQRFDALPWSALSEQSRKAIIQYEVLKWEREKTRRKLMGSVRAYSRSLQMFLDFPEWEEFMLRAGILQRKSAVPARKPVGTALVANETILRTKALLADLGLDFSTKQTQEEQAK